MFQMEGDVKGVATQTKPAPADLFCIHMSAVIVATHYRNIHQINQYLCPSFASCIRRFTKSPLSAVHHCTTQPPAWIQCKDGRKWSLLKDSDIRLVTYFRYFYLTLDPQQPGARKKYQVSWPAITLHPATCCETSQLDPVLAMRCLCSSSS